MLKIIAPKKIENLKKMYMKKGRFKTETVRSFAEAFLPNSI